MRSAIVETNQETLERRYRIFELLFQDREDLLGFFKCKTLQWG